MDLMEIDYDLSQTVFADFLVIVVAVCRQQGRIVGTLVSASGEKLDERSVTDR